MDINDKIAARRRELEQARQAEVAAELERKQAEYQQQEQARAEQLQQEQAATAKVHDSFIRQGYVSRQSTNRTLDTDVEAALLKESVERIPAGQIVLFVFLVVCALGNLYNGFPLRSLGFAALAVAFITLVIRHHRRKILLTPQPAPTHQPSTPEGEHH